MRSQRVPFSELLSCAVAALLLGSAGCGSDSGADPYESETTRAIRQKVQADMEIERLRRHGRQIAFVNEALAKAPTAVMATAVASDAGSMGSSATGIARGEALYTQNCASCHGARGEGDGPVAASLVPQPAKHSDGGYMNALSDEHLMKVIEQGGAAVGKSPMMAPWGGTLSDDQIRDVITFMRSLADPPYSGASS